VISQTKTDSLKAKLETCENDSLRADLLFELGDHLIIKTHGEALNYYLDAKSIYQALNDTSGIVYSLIGIADVHSMMGEYKEALAHISLALELSKGKYELLASTHSRLAIEYYQMGDYELSLKNDYLSLKYNSLINDTVQIAYDYHNIGTHHLTLGAIDTAINYYHRSIKELGAHKDVLRAYNNSRIGFANSFREQYDSAIFYHYKALEYFTKDSLIYDMAMEENYISSAYFNMRKLDEAENHARTTLTYAQRLNNHDLFIQNYALLYDIYNYKKDYKKALEYTLLRMAYADSLEQKNKENIINSIESKWKFAEQETLLKTSQKNNKELAKQKKKLILFSSISALLLIFSLFALNAIIQEHRINKKLVKQLNGLSKSQQNLLSIISHDLRGSIGNLKNFTELMHHKMLDNESMGKMLKQFPPMVDSTHSLLETILQWSDSQQNNNAINIEIIKVEQLVDLTIEHLNYLANEKTIEVIHSRSELEILSDKNMLLTVLRNLLSNAIKFSNTHSSIWINYELNDSNLVLTVKDEGMGMTQSEVAKILNHENIIKSGTNGERGTGLGLKLCHSFIKKHKGQLTIESTPQKGTEVKLLIPQKA